MLGKAHLTEQAFFSKAEKWKTSLIPEENWFGPKHVTLLLVLPLSLQFAAISEEERLFRYGQYCVWQRATETYLTLFSLQMIQGLLQNIYSAAVWMLVLSRLPGGSHRKCVHQTLYCLDVSSLKCYNERSAVSLLCFATPSPQSPSPADDSLDSHQ